MHRWVRDGHLIRLGRGVFADARQVSLDFAAAVRGAVPWQEPPQSYGPADLRAWLEAAVAGRSTRCHLSGRAARAAWALPEQILLGEPASLVVPTVSTPRWASGQHQHSTRMTMCDLPTDLRSAVDGLPAVHPTWVAAEALCKESPARGLMVADAAAHRGLTTVQEISALLDLWKGRSGIRRARQTVGLVDPRRESPLESASAVTMDRLGLPRPLWQVELFDERGVFVARVDCGWLRLGVLGEADGKTKYVDALGGARAREERVWGDHVRQADVVDLGWELFRWIDRERYDDPSVIAARFRRACARFAARRQRGERIRGFVRLDGKLVPARTLI